MTSTYSTQTRFSTDSRSSSAYYVEEDEQDGLLGHRSEQRQVAHAEPHVPKSKAKSATRWILPLLLVAALGAGLVGLSLFCRPHSELQVQVAGEFNGLVPDFPVRPVVFDQDPLATIHHPSSPAEMNATEANWLSYMPIGNGFLAVDDLRSNGYALPPPIDFEEKDAFALAVFHQLHCLHTIMTTYNGVVNGSIQMPSRHNHIDHCFRYLRQSILCCGDVALEGQDPNSTRPATDGSGAIHMCKDIDEIKSWAQDRRIVNTHVL